VRTFCINPASQPWLELEYREIWQSVSSTHGSFAQRKDKPMPVKTLRLFGTLAAIASVAPAAQAASVKEIFEKYGLLGNFAWDCSKPPSPDDNWHYVNRLIDADHVQRDYMTGPTTRQWVVVFDKASELKPNEVMVSGQITGRLAGRTVENEPIDGIWRIEQNRIQQWASTFQGKPLIVDGRLNGRDLPWLVRCAPPHGAGISSPAVTQEARTEVLKITTLTLTDHQFLTGARDGTAVTISGEVRIPKSGDERLPAIMLLHGSGGIARNVHDWVDVFNAMGIATFAPDSFTGRGLRSIASNQTALGRMVQVFDAYRALEVLAKHPRVDRTRIALMGWSRGGSGPLYASLRRFQEMHGPPGAAFAAYIPFYAPCHVRLREEEDVADKPIRIFHGAADDLVPVAPCRAYVERLRKAGKDIQLTEYPGARHLFDNVDFQPPRYVAQIQSSRRCRLEERANGEIVNSETNRPFSFNDSCVDRGSTLAYDEAAYKASIQAVTQFLRTTLKLH
jgi:dienelactone hydrolase